MSPLKAKNFISQFINRHSRKMPKTWQRWLQYGVRALDLSSGRWILPLLIVVISLTALYGASFLAELIYDNEVARVMSQEALISIFAIPGIIVLTSLVIMLKIFIEWVRREPGTSLRFKIITFFSLTMILPVLIFSILFTELFDFTLYQTFANQLLIENLENDLIRNQAEISRRKKTNENELRALRDEQKITQEWRLNAEATIDLIMILNAQSKVMSLHPHPKLRLKNIPSFSLSEEWPVMEAPKEPSDNKTTTSPSPGTFFSSYKENNGIIYTLHQGQENTAIALSFIPAPLKNEITTTLQTIGQFKQFETLLLPFKTLAIILLIYLYVQIFSVAIIIFYYRSNQYLIPISKLIRTLGDLPQENLEKSASFPEIIKKETRLAEDIKRLRGNEIGKLLEAFQSMRHQLRRDRIRLAETLELKGWKDAATKLAHEIKNPLTPMLLSLHSIRDRIIRYDFTLYEEVHDEFNLIEFEIKRISNLINEFASFSKESHLEHKEFPVQIIFERLLSQLRSYEDITIIADWKGKKHLYADADKIYGILLNLTQNAIAAVQSMPQEYKKILKILTNTVTIEKQSYYEVQIHDNGIGVPEHMRTKLFKPYTTFKKTGMGLGLTISRQIALAHGGDVFLKPTQETDAETQWTIFVLRIPIKHKSLPPPPSDNIFPEEENYYF